jgi:hypothetical protein
MKHASAERLVLRSGDWFAEHRVWENDGRAHLPSASGTGPGNLERSGSRLHLRANTSAAAPIDRREDLIGAGEVDRQRQRWGRILERQLPWIWDRSEGTGLGYQDAILGNEGQARAGPRSLYSHCRRVEHQLSKFTLANNALNCQRPLS